MSQFINHIKLALENVVLCRGDHNPKDSYAYAYRMEKMLKTQLRDELTDILDDNIMMEERLCEFIGKLNKNINEEEE